MKFTLSLAAAAAAVFAIGVSAHPPVGDGEELMHPQTGSDITDRLSNITANVVVLRDTFMAFLSRQVDTTDDAKRVSKELQDYLDETGTYFANGALSEDTVALDDKESLWVRQQYDFLYRNVTIVTRALRKNIKVVEQTKYGTDTVGAILPKLEGSFDTMYSALNPYISQKYKPSIATIHSKLDDQLEETIHAYKFNDISPDDNPIAGSHDFPADGQVDPDIFNAMPIPVPAGKDQTGELTGGKEKMVPKKQDQAETGSINGVKPNSAPGLERSGDPNSLDGSNDGKLDSTQGSTDTQWMVGKGKKVAKPASDWINKNMVDKNMMKPKGPEDK